MITSVQVRLLRSQFRESKQHQFLRQAKLVADSQNTTVLFNVAGMQQLVPYLSGKDHPLGRRLYNIQKCIRTNDIDGIGDERHLSMFEMMGNRSLGDYFKQESLEWSVEFLVDILGIEKTKLGATVFAGDDIAHIPQDEESVSILKSLGIQHIKQIGFDKNGESDNFWTPGPIGPCGPCCEFYYDRGDSFGSNDRDMGVNDRYIEIWNNVFMAYYADGSGTLKELPQKNVDTGMGFERLLMVLQNKETIFETDIFVPIIQIIEQSTGISYPPFTSTEISTHTRSFRIVADHIRSSIALIDEGVIANNEGIGYILRRFIRRLYYHITKLNENVAVETIITQLVSQIQLSFGQYLEFSLDKQLVIDALMKEIVQFESTIKNGKKHLTSLIHQGVKTITGEYAFKLYDTYGFPVELTQEICQQYEIGVDMDGYYKYLEDAKLLSRDRQNFKKNIDWSAYISDMPPTQFVYDVYHMSDAKILKTIVVDNQKIIILDKTPMYAEGGGQVGDKGTIVLDTGEVYEVCDVKKFEGVFLHFVK